MKGSQQRGSCWASLLWTMGASTHWAAFSLALSLLHQRVGGLIQVPTTSLIMTEGCSWCLWFPDTLDLPHSGQWEPTVESAGASGYELSQDVGMTHAMGMYVGHGLSLPQWCNMRYAILYVYMYANGLPLVAQQWRICLQGRRGRRPRFNPWVRKMPWSRAWQPVPVFLPGESHGLRSLVGYSP